MNAGEPTRGILEWPVAPRTNGDLVLAFVKRLGERDPGLLAGRELAGRPLREFVQAQFRHQGRDALARIRDGLRCGSPVGTCSDCIYRRDAFYRPLRRPRRKRLRAQTS